MTGDAHDSFPRAWLRDSDRGLRAGVGTPGQGTGRRADKGLGNGRELHSAFVSGDT